jgi:hypothetical protein
MKALDQNGNKLSANVKSELVDGAKVWGATVWFGGGMQGSFATTVRRYYYETRDQARAADISHAIGSNGRVA